MEPSARENYLATEVMTATPQKLQLMMLDAAIRSAERTQQHWRAEEDEEASETLIHAQQIMGELVAGLDREGDTELVKKVAAVYLFVFRSLTEANFYHDEAKLNDAIKILKVERETWRQVCDQLGTTKRPGEESFSAASIEQTSTEQPQPVQSPEIGAPLDSPDMVGDLPTSGFSIDA